MKFKKILKEKALEEKIREEAKTFRKRWEKKLDWSQDKQCFRNKCQFITKKLVDWFEKRGYDAERIGGYYYPPEYWFDIKNEPIEDGKWKHWWVLVEDEYIVDVTAEQFHPRERDLYKVVVTNMNDISYEF